MRDNTVIIVAWLVLMLACVQGRAADKNGVSPQVISLPSGPGSIQGLGESYQPQLNSGAGAYSIPIQLPVGPAGLRPTLALQYQTGNGNGCLGIGWRISGLTMVSRNMDSGLPLYVDEANGADDDLDGITDNPEEIDRFSGIDLEELVGLPDATFRSENESSFLRYERAGANWRARSKGGLLHEFGTTSAARIEQGKRVFAWLLDRITDLNGNSIEYRYMSDASSPGQKYCKEIRWPGEQAFYDVVFVYEGGRPDVHTDFRSGFEVRTGLRLTRLDVIAQGVPPSKGALTGDLNEDGIPDSLVRRYVLEYEPNAMHSLLTKVTLFGSDAVTAMPPLTFAYTEWQPLDNVAVTMTPSFGEPAAALDSDNVELIDMNSDGLPDLLQATATAHRVHLNLGLKNDGRLAWNTVGEIVTNAPSLNLGSTAVHLADHTADGNADLIHRVNSTTIQCFINSGRRTWSSAVNLGNTDSWPLWPFENTGSRTLDTDHNRMHDVLFTSNNSYSLWMLMPGGRYGRETALPVLSDGTQAFTFADPGARIADVNGDRISDLAWIQSTRVVYWASCGRGNFEGPIFLPLTGSLQAAEITRSEFADVNGDGLADLLVVRPAASPNGIHYRLNRGVAGFDVRRTILGLPAVQSGDATRRADMNGNGSVDFLISNSARPAGTREQFLDFVPGSRPQLLRRIDNGLGLVTTLEYQTSVQQMVQAAAAGVPWTSTMPISIPVVSRITESDGRGNAFVREVTYRDPHFDSVKQEFRGFTHAEEREIGDGSAATKITRYTFDPGITADCRKGKIIGQEIADAGGTLFQQAENGLQHRVLETAADGRQVCFAFNHATDLHLFEPTGAPAHLRTEYQYDDFGNVLHENRHGVLDQPGDEVFTEKEYLYQPDRWLMDRVSRSVIRDAAGNLAAEERFVYDQRGNLAENHQWLSTDDRFIVVLRNEYDAFGNVVRTIDANGHARSFGYDSLVHAYATSETIHLGPHDLTARADYDMVLGTMVSSEDFAGARSDYRYDALGRLIVLARPAGARTDYQYDFGNPVSRVVIRVRETTQSEGTFDSFEYFDGYGRKLGTKVEAEDGQWRFLEAVKFNSRKLEENRWLPYFTSTPQYELPDDQLPHQEMTYDVKGRKIATTNPDGTLTQTVFEPLVQHEHDEIDAAGAATPKTLRKDGLDRLVEVIERSGSEEFQTRYSWNVLGDLTEALDAQGNQKSIVYDSLKRAIALHDPDRGTMNYAYDDAGNLIRTTDARGQQILYTYDFANRLVSENYLDQVAGVADPIDVRYIYDVPSQNIDLGNGLTGTATFTAGRLASVIDLSGEEHLSYDARGNVIRTIKRLQDAQLGVLAAYTTEFAFDQMDRISAVHYPDGDRCVYTYNASSFLESAGGGLGGQMIISGTAYEPTGEPQEITYGNGTTTLYSYDDRDRLFDIRMSSPQSGDAMHYIYEYDLKSNLVAVNDQRPFQGLGGVPADAARRNTQRFAYDDLDRLTSARYTPVNPDTASLGTISYSYDAIGNMLSQVSDLPQAHLGEMSFAGGRFSRAGRLAGELPGPHALTGTQSGDVSEYDDNGNVSHVNGAAFIWDFKDQLVRFQKGKIDARYTYDYTGRRAAKLVADGKRSVPTLYANRNFEIRPNRAPVKYVFLGSKRLARVTDMLDPSQECIQRLWLFEGWNLLTLTVQTAQTAADVFGPGAQVYEWTGTTYRKVPAHEGLPPASPLWVEVAGPRLAIAKGMYLSPGEPLLVPSGQNLVAWPRNEPFVPGLHLSAADSQVRGHDAELFQWLLRDPFLPSGVNDGIDSFAAAGAVWITATTPIHVLPGAAGDRGVTFYHADHLGSSHLITDRHGAVLQEVAYFPFGQIRHRHEPASFARDPYGFTQKEQDDESDLHYFEARYLAAKVGRFLSPDPKFVNPGMLHGDDLASYLTQPQKGNLYAYVLNAPTNRVDPTGLDDEFAVSFIEGLSQAAEKTGIALDVLQDARAAGIARATGVPLDAAKQMTAFKSAPVIHGVATGAGIALNVKEAYEFIKEPTLEKGAHLGGTTAITVGGFVSGPGAAIAGAAQYTYDNSPRIHDAANRAGDWAAQLPGGSRVSGGIVAAEVSVGLTLLKLGTMPAGPGATQGFDMALEWLLD